MAARLFFVSSSCRRCARCGRPGRLCMLLGVARAWPLGGAGRPWLIFLVGRLWLCWGLFFVFRPAFLVARRLNRSARARRRRRFECLGDRSAVVAPSCLSSCALVLLLLLIKQINSDAFLLCIAAERARFRFAPAATAS